MERLFVVLVTLGLTSPVLALSPPWYTHWAKVKATVGADPCVTTGELKEISGGGYEGAITVCNREKAAAIARLLPSEVKVGASIRQIVLDGHGQAVPPETLVTPDPEHVRQLIERALKGNRYFFGSDRDGRGFVDVWVEFNPVVIQVWADNLADKYGNQNSVAAETFGEVLGLRDFGGVAVGITSRPVH